MKHIVKNGAPQDYKDWCNNAKEHGNDDYRNLPSKERKILQEALLEEQGYICAYTMRRIDINCSHIEHIRPQTVCRSDNGEKGSDLKYDNLIACFPRENLKKTYRYGAQEKGGWWENEGRDFISPLMNSCELHFQFNLKGEIKPVNNHIAAKTTIQVLKLDHKSLTDDRKRVINEFIYGSNGRDPLSINKALRIIEEICKRNKKGEFYEFCIAIKQALQQHITIKEKAAAARNFARASRDVKKSKK